jgi:hypothetical protein
LDVDYAASSAWQLESTTRAKFRQAWNCNDFNVWRVVTPAYRPAAAINR